MEAISAAVENSSWLIGRPDLQLHKESSIMVALGAFSLDLINVFPRLLSSHHIVDLLALKIHLHVDFLLDWLDVGASLAVKSDCLASNCFVGGGALGLIDGQDVGAGGAEEHFCFIESLIYFL